MTKTAFSPPFLFLFLCPSFAGAGVAPVSAVVSAQDAREAFRTQLTELGKQGATEAMGQLVQQNEDEAVIWVIEVAEAVSEAPSDELFEKLAMLRKGWKAGMATRFVEEMEKYFSLLEGKMKTQRSQLRKEYGRALERFQKATGDTISVTEIVVLAGEFVGMGQTFEQFGDKYYASQALYHAGTCADATYLKEQADLHRTCKSFGKALELRDSIGLQDGVHDTMKPRFDQLMAQGFDVEKKAGGAVPPPAAKSAAVDANAVSIPLSFALADDFEAVVRPCYFLDDIYPMWNVLGLGAKGTKTDFPRLPDLPVVLRLGANEVAIDLDKDGKGDVEVPLTGNVEAVELDIGKGAEQRRWAFLAVVGIQKDTYQGFEMNLEPDDNQIQIYTAPAASMTGTIGTTPVRVFDDNMDGVCGSAPMTYGYIGCTPGVFAPEMDAIQVGAEVRARPWSEYIEIDDAWYKLTSEKGGTVLTAAPTIVKTGVLKLKSKGPAPSWLVVKGRDTWQNCYFDISQGGAKGTVVPAGSYTLYYGEVRSGKGKQMLKALIVPGAGTREWIVPEGGEAVAEVGGPFAFDFEFQTDTTTVKVLGNTIAVVGAAGERYERPWGCVVRPEAAYRVKGSKRGGKPEKMELVQHQDDVSKLGWAAAWFPRDLELQKKEDETEVEVQLTEKSHKLFGKIESAWKE